MWPGSSGSRRNEESPSKSTMSKKSGDDGKWDDANTAGPSRRFSFSPSPPRDPPLKPRLTATEGPPLPAEPKSRDSRTSDSDESEDEAYVPVSEQGFATYTAEGLDAFLTTPVDEQRRMVGLLDDKDAIQTPMKVPRSPDTSTYGEVAMEMLASGLLPKSLAVRNRSIQEAFSNESWLTGDQANDPSWHRRLQEYQVKQSVPLEVVRAMHEDFMVAKMSAERTRLNNIVEDIQSKEDHKGQIRSRDKEIERLRKQLILLKNTGPAWDDSGLGSTQSTPQTKSRLGGALASLPSQRQDHLGPKIAVTKTPSKILDDAEPQRVLADAKNRLAELKQMIVQTRLENCELFLQRKTINVEAAEGAVRRAIEAAREYEGASIRREAGYDEYASAILKGKTHYWHGRVMLANDAWHPNAVESFEKAQPFLYKSDTREELHVEDWLEKAYQRCEQGVEG